jgi:hypothetical protein
MFGSGQLTGIPLKGGFFKRGLQMIMFDDCEKLGTSKMKTECAAFAWRAVTPRRTYDFGFREDCQGVGMVVRNGRVFEKTLNKQIFLTQRKS